jgi:hypothetical protein
MLHAQLLEGLQPVALAPSLRPTVLHFLARPAHLFDNPMLVEFRRLSIVQ